MKLVFLILPRSELTQSASHSQEAQKGGLTGLVNGDREPPGPSSRDLPASSSLRLLSPRTEGAPRTGGWTCVCAGAKDKAAQDERERPRNACSTERSNYKDRLQASQVALVVKNPPADAGDAGSIPESGRPPEGGHGNPLQYSCLENPKDTGAWRTTVHRVAKNRT